jgi:peroxiredoxin
MNYCYTHSVCRLPLLFFAGILLLAGCGEQRFLAPDAPDFTLPNLTGSAPISLEEYRGDVVYVTFWASWCAPCREEMPLLADLWQRHRDEGFQVIAINVDEDPAAALQFAQEHGLEFPLARDADRAVSQLYRVAGYPSHYLVDRRGKVRFSALGFTEADALAVAQEVETLLAEPVGAAN